ncbi:MAG: O-antigen ligase family protein [Brachybacterium sp.]|uniref:O-antigen ligase family protein n=1 Tax=Brachybacterium sp. TaxID=1891286 RepID=UPI0026492D28|nr:O-antigen ligase family protein [Brachybacterium sp.]MDN5687721.1 O-antigen ligase family protein [Brachybacterium sp.]
MTVARLTAVWFVQLLLVLSVVPWRSDEIFDGGLDPTVVGKAAVAVVGLLGAAAIAWTSNLRYPIGLGPAALAVVAVLVSTLGAVVADSATPTIVLAIRVAILVATVLLILYSVPWDVGVGTLLAAMATVALVAGVTGIPDALSEGRLGGGVPRLHPNPLAELAGAPLVGLTVLMLRHGVRVWSAFPSTVLLAIIIATGSRTAFLAVAVAILVGVAVNGIRDRSIVYLLLASAPVLYAMAVLTDALRAVATRAGSTDATSTLEARFDAWRVVLGWGWTAWEKWIGLGLATKTVPVDSRWRDEQVLDSSWVSILAQSGILGMLLIGALAAWCVITAWTSTRRRWLVLPLLVVVFIRTITESGLVGGALPFVQFMVLATVLTGRSRHIGAAAKSRQLATGGRFSSTSRPYSEIPNDRALGERSVGER